MKNQPKIVMIPVAKIRVINPRSRNKVKFQKIADNISNLGLKRPIKVSRRIETDGDDGYDLICGQGRLEAFIMLGHKEVPAIVDDVPREERLLMSLVENIARRSPRTMEMVRQVGILRDRGYNNTQIAKKIDMDHALVGGIIRLLDKGEERLLTAVERGQIPISVAVMIASSDDAHVQKALTEAYEKKLLQGKAVLRARKIVEQRNTYGKTQRGPKKILQKFPTSDAIVRAYNKEAQRQRLMVKKAKLCETRLLVILNALRHVFADENFVTLLRAEKLDTLPAYLAENIRR